MRIIFIANFAPSERRCTTFTSPEYNRLKSEFVRLRTFQEEWIPGIKAGGFSRFALYDLKADPLQKRDISKQRLEVTNRLKTKLLELYKDVMACSFIPSSISYVSRDLNNLPIS